MLEKKNYKSPSHKLIEFFEKSRDNWKSKCVTAKYNIKLLKTTIRDLRISRENWKNKCKVREQELRKQESQMEIMQIKLDELKKNFDRIKEPNPENSFKIRPRNHSYSTDQITLFILMILEGAIGFRASSRIMRLNNQFFNLSLPVPTGNTGRLWLMRLGYYKLIRPKQKATDWIWIIDHTIQLGKEKCLLILGIRLCDMPVAGRCFSHEDLEPIELYPVNKSNGEIVYQQLEETVEKTGVPRAIISDHGSDLNVGVKLFCKQHAETSQLYDIKHKTAAILKRELSHDENWNEFIKKANRTKKQVQQTDLAFLQPPNQKTKARYMNVGELIQWVVNIQYFMNHHTQQAKPEYDLNHIKEKFGWIEDYQQDIDGWKEMFDVINQTEQFVRHQGLSFDNCRELCFQLPFEYKQERSERLNNELIQFVSQQTSCVNPNECLPASSEIIESCFGKQKQIEKTQAKKGFTGLILTLPALVAKTTHDIVHQALESVPTKQVIDWYRQRFGQSIQAKRKNAFANLSIK
jgi:hypothetical protein